MAPISIVLTTLAAAHYRGERSVSIVLSKILDGILDAVARAELTGQRLTVYNPKNPSEDLSERWGENHDEYRAFKAGIRAFHQEWKGLLAKRGKVHKELENLFGEPVQKAIAKQAARLQEARRRGGVGVSKAGLISTAATAVLPMRPNTFHGQD